MMKNRRDEGGGGGVRMTTIPVNPIGLNFISVGLVRLSQL